MTATLDRRYNTGLEIRASEGGVSVLRGYAALFDSVYSMGLFTEEIDKGAFRNANISDVRILKNHDPNIVLGRTSAGTARVGVDERGFWYEVDLPRSPDGENMRVAIERGDITQSSWGFYIRDTPESMVWEKRNGKPHVRIMDVELVLDASPVTFPANPETSINARMQRSLDTFVSEEDTAPEADFEITIRKKKLEFLQKTR